MEKNKKSIVFFLLVYGLAILAPLHTTIESLNKEKANNCKLCEWLVSQNEVAKQILNSPKPFNFLKVELIFELEKNQFYKINPTIENHVGIYFRGPPHFTI